MIIQNTTYVHDLASYIFFFANNIKLECKHNKPKKKMDSQQLND